MPASRNLHQPERFADPGLEEFLQSRVGSGRYQTDSKVIREGLRWLEQREQARDTALEELAG